MSFLAMLRRLARLLLVLAAPLPVAFAAPPAIDLVVDLDPGSRRLTVVATITPVPPTFRFVLHESLAIAAASADGRPLPITAGEQQGSLRRWQLPLPAGSRSLRVEYQGTLPALDARLDHRQVHAAGARRPAGPSSGAAPIAADGCGRRQLPARRRGLVSPSG